MSIDQIPSNEEETKIDNKIKEKKLEKDMIEEWLKHNEVTKVKDYVVSDTQAIGGGINGKGATNKHFTSDKHYKNVKHS